MVPPSGVEPDIPPSQGENRNPSAGACCRTTYTLSGMTSPCTQGTRSANPHEVFSTPARTRTRTYTFEACNDIPFTTGACCNCHHLSLEGGTLAWLLNPGIPVARDIGGKCGSRTHLASFADSCLSGRPTTQDHGARTGGIQVYPQEQG